MFDGRALLFLLLLLAVLVWRARTVGGRRRVDSGPVGRPSGYVTPLRRIRVVCGDCGTELCEVLTPRDADLESEAHHLFAHSGGGS